MGGGGGGSNALSCFMLPDRTIQMSYLARLIHCRLFRGNNFVLTKEIFIF